MAHISLKEYWMGRDITHKSELTDEIIKNAENTLSKINALLKDLKWASPVYVSSGWRPISINSKVAGAAKKSLHTIGCACDIKDDANQTLGKTILKYPELLKKHGLWIEDLNSTKGWVHIDTQKRADRDVQVFKP